MKLDKGLVDNVIRLTRKYYETGDIDYIPAINKTREVLKRSSSLEAIDLLIDLAKYTQFSGKGTYNNIYKALEAFGIIVEDKEKENDSKRNV